MENQEKTDVLKSFLDFWDKLDEKTQAYVSENSYLITYQPGQNLHNGDCNCLGVIFVISGTLRVYIMSEEGKEVTLYREEAGDVCVLSASCVLSEITFDVHIDSETETRALVLRADAFYKLIQNNIYFENFQNKVKSQRMSDIMWTMQQILFFSFDKRLAIFLYDEVVKHGPIITYSHLEIAKYLGSAREVVSRMLKYFEKEGILKISRKEIEVIDKKKLFEHTK